MCIFSIKLDLGPTYICLDMRSLNILYSKLQTKWALNIAIFCHFQVYCLYSHPNAAGGHSRGFGHSRNALLATAHNANDVHKVVKHLELSHKTLLNSSS